MTSFLTYTSSGTHLKSVGKKLIYLYVVVLDLFPYCTLYPIRVRRSGEDLHRTQEGASGLRFGRARRVKCKIAFRAVRVTLSCQPSRADASPHTHTHKNRGVREERCVVCAICVVQRMLRHKYHTRHVCLFCCRRRRWVCDYVKPIQSPSARFATVL